MLFYMKIIMSGSTDVTTVDNFFLVALSSNFHVFHRKIIYKKSIRVLEHTIKLRPASGYASKNDYELVSNPCPYH